jgi:hypothetical protein
MARRLWRSRLHTCGPPAGHGQVANTIAAAAYDGKSVLFIAEKMVALKVVHVRLKNAGLGALCLQLHSNKANKRGLTEELKQTLSSGAAEPGLADDITPSLTETRDAEPDRPRSTPPDRGNGSKLSG